MPLSGHRRRTSQRRAPTTRPLRSGGTEERKQRVLTHGTPSITSTIAEAVVVKDGDLFLLVEPDGRIAPTAEHGMGLYFEDCRFLRTFEITLNDTRPVALGSTSAPGNRAAFELTNPDLRLRSGAGLRKEELGLRWEHHVTGEPPALTSTLTIQNWSLESVRLPLKFRFDAQFEDVFEVRGLLDQTRRTRDPPRWQGRSLHFHRRGIDHRDRSLVVTFDCDVTPLADGTAVVWVELGPRDISQWSVRVALGESDVEDAAEPGGRLVQPRRRSAHAPAHHHATVHSDSLLLDGTIRRSFEDLHLLTSEIDGEEFFAAGLPWFGTLFGRDSIISALQVLPYSPLRAEQTLRLLARYQGGRVDDWRDEQPGKILHELRVGELARAGEIPHTPYYGSVDATPLFLILLAEHARWTGDLGLFRRLQPNVQRALDWIDNYGDGDGDGYIEYRSSSRYGLINQGWKDSGNAILDADGRLAEPPIALVEVQGYVYAAKRAIAEVYARSGDLDRSDRLEREAARLQAGFNRDFWLEERGHYALALEAEKRPLEVMSSNAGQVLWSGIADSNQARRTATHLMAEDMFSGWGIRTLSSRSRGYNPIGYHLGTVWPHDNSLIAAGLKRYAHDRDARRVFQGITAAAMHFEHSRLPELFTGFSNEDYDVPIRYPVACHPQAWAAGAVPYLLQALLGLEADGFAGRLRVVRPMLPAGVDRLQVSELRVGRGRVSLRFTRGGDGACAVETLESEMVDVEVEPGEPESS